MRVGLSSRSYCNPADPKTRSSEGLQQLKRHIGDLSRESIAEDLEDTAREIDWTLRRQKKAPSWLGHRAISSAKR